MKRKIASAMCLVMMGVNFAAPIYAETTPGEVSVNGSGATTYVSTEHYEVVVPTSASFDFNLDPQNLLSLDTNGKKSLDDLKKNSVAAGAIYGTTPLVFANLGTDEVSISAKINVTGDVTALDDDDEVVVAPTTGNSAFNVKLALVPYKVEANADATYKINSTANASLFKATTTAFKSNSDDKVRGVAFDNTNSTLTFKLAAPSWNITKKGENSYELDMDQTTNNKAVAFGIAGTCNSKADWSDFKKTGSDKKQVGLTATFTLAKAADDFTPNVTLNLGDDTTAPSVAIPSGSAKKLIEVPVLNTAPATPTAIESSNITVSGKEITIGGFTGTASLTSVKIGDTTAESTDYTAVTTTANSLKVTLTEDSTAARTVVVTFTVGNTTYTATAEVAAVDAAPSLTDDSTTYTVGNATTVDVGYSLGSGDLAATGLTITYTKSSGAVTLTSGTDYTLADGKIKLSSSHITAFKGISGTSREYTVKFNDSANTSKKFTLTK